MPARWTVDAVKVALLLRCADAAHIDHRRAPRLLLTLTRPTGIARAHWTFQERLAKPQLRDRKLLYTSKSPFGVEHAEAWQLCWDTVRMIDGELSDANDIFVERETPPFRAVGVVGAKSATALAEHIQVKGWKPIPTEIQVSDVPGLARTLGGPELYSYPFAPLRELVQNAADAIDARAAIDSDFRIEDGQILVRIKYQPDASIVLEVEDIRIGAT